MLVLLNVPDTVWKGPTLSAGDFLLLETPFRELNLVREKRAASHSMDEPKFRLNGPQSLFGNSAFGEVGNDFNPKYIVGITSKSLMTIRSTHFVNIPILCGFEGGGGETYDTSFCQSASVTGGRTS